MYSHQVLFICLFINLLSVQLVLGQYQIPDPTIEAFTPKGFKMQIPSEKGLKKVGFHIKINEEFTHQTQGQLFADVLSPNENDVWEYKNEDVILKIGDIVNYWLFAQIDGIGYRKNPNKWKIEELIPLPGSNVSETDVSQPGTTNGECVPSITVAKEITPCRGQLIFEEEFNGPDLQKNVWKYEQYIARSPDYEFQSYQTSNKNVFIDKGILHIRPTLLSDTLSKGTIFNGTLDLVNGCTKTSRTECFHETKSYHILPPIVSGKITTKKSFSFQYGKIEIRAKFPEGDWIYPQLFLLPTTETYGSGYDSGVISVAMAHGNENVQVLSKNINIDSRELYSGIILGKQYPLRDIAMKKFRSPDGSGWNKNFHVYSLTWKPGSITMSVNNKTFGTFQPPKEGYSSIEKMYSPYGTSKWNNPQAPFNKEFYISLAVVVGGIYEFPDDIQNGNEPKPWSNELPKFLLDFWKSRDKWYKTWVEPKSDLQIDSIRVWAL